MYARHGTWLSYFDYEDQGQLHLHDEMGSRLASTRMKLWRILRSEAEEPLDPRATTVPGNRPHPAPLASCTLRWMAMGMTWEGRPAS